MLLAVVVLPVLQRSGSSSDCNSAPAFCRLHTQPPRRSTVSSHMSTTHTSSSSASHRRRGCVNALVDADYIILLLHHASATPAPCDLCTSDVSNNHDCKQARAAIAPDERICSVSPRMVTPPTPVTTPGCLSLLLRMERRAVLADTLAAATSCGKPLLS